MNMSGMCHVDEQAVQLAERIRRRRAFRAWLAVTRIGIAQATAFHSLLAKRRLRCQVVPLPLGLCSCGVDACAWMQGCLAWRATCSKRVVRMQKLDRVQEVCLHRSKESAKYQQVISKDSASYQQEAERNRHGVSD